MRGSLSKSAAQERKNPAACFVTALKAAVNDNFLI